EEQLLPIRIESRRYVEWPAQGEAVRVVLVWRLLESRTLTGPRIRIERIVLMTPEHVATKALRPALRNETQLSGGRAAVLSLIIGGQHLHFGDGIEVLRTHHEAAGLADTDRRRAIDRCDELVRTAAVDRCHSGRECADTGRHRAAHVAR